MLEERRGEFRHLFREFAESYFETEEGQEHVAAYPRSREDARMHLESVLAAHRRGGDTTDLVLLKTLPYSDTPAHRSKGAWVSVTPAISGDVKVWFETNKWVQPEEWPQIAEAILGFVLRCSENPSQLNEACQWFSSSPYSKGFQAGMLTPVLNALRPDDYALINNKTRQVINHFAGTNHSQTLADYPTTNEAARQFVKDAAHYMHEVDAPDMRDSDLFDAFCHWLVAVKKYDFSARYWKVAPGEQAWNWEACRDGGFMAMGWDDLGDISDLNRQQFEAKTRWRRVVRTGVRRCQPGLGLCPRDEGGRPHRGQQGNDGGAVHRYGHWRVPLRAWRQTRTPSLRPMG